MQSYPDIGLLTEICSESMQPKRIEDSFNRLKTWIEDSLDLYKLELQSILYPLFVHIYLDLIGRDYCMDGMLQFWS